MRAVEDMCSACEDTANAQQADLRRELARTRRKLSELRSGVRRVTSALVAPVPDGNMAARLLLCARLLRGAADASELRRKKGVRRG